MNESNKSPSPLQLAMNKLNNQLNGDVDDFTSKVKSKENFIDTMEKRESEKIIPPSVDEITQKIKKSGAVVNELASGLFGSLSGQLKQFREQIKENQEKTKELMASNDEVDEGIGGEEEKIRKPKFIEPKKVDTSSVPKVKKQAKSSPSTSNIKPNDFDFPHLIVDDMSALLSSMSGKTIDIPHSEHSWQLMDKLADGIKKQWANIISNSSFPPYVVSSWLDDWKKINMDIKNVNDSWPSEATLTSKWSDQSINEIASLSNWFPRENQANDFVLPNKFKGTGDFPSAGLTMPKNFVNDMAYCADLFEYAKTSTSFSWSDDMKNSFSSKVNTLENWKPRNKDESSWKESALDRYAILRARIETLTPAPTPSIKDNIKTTKSVAKKAKVAKKVAKKSARKKTAKKSLAK